ncbi:MAG: CatB-related O-acetyltransferase [Lachnospiraceae bacterium]|nr:CatB-related O-acetyltransferase [Lachnospiraceae bacterium]
MLVYYWYKILKKLRGRAIKNSKIDRKAKVEAGSVFLSSSMKKYSYCGYDCQFVNVEVGAFCSISNNVVIGGGNHPLNWVSTSPAFYKGRDSISKRLATLEYDSSDAHTIIGNDVWIGNGVLIKPGVIIGDGAVLGMGSVVTKDVEPYTIVGGNPAKVIRKRFDDETIQKLLAIKWWEWEDDKILSYSKYFNDTNELLSKLEE